MDPVRILVVDDDAGVREAVCEALGWLGYATESVGGAGEALARFRPGRYRVVVTDLSMPRMNGLQLVRRLRALEPGLPIMIFSGGDPPAGSGLELPGIGVARKPDVDALTQLIARTLGPPGAGVR